MSSARDNGGPAFPLPSPAAEWAPERKEDDGTLTPACWKATKFSGMSLRDYFAAKAIVAVLADPYFREKADTMGYGEFADEAAEQAYVVADAMLKARDA